MPRGVLCDFFHLEICVGMRSIILENLSLIHLAVLEWLIRRKVTWFCCQNWAYGFKLLRIKHIYNMKNNYLQFQLNPFSLFGEDSRTIDISKFLTEGCVITKGEGCKFFFQEVAYGWDTTFLKFRAESILGLRSDWDPYKISFCPFPFLEGNGLEQKECLFFSGPIWLLPTNFWVNQAKKADRQTNT